MAFEYCLAKLLTWWEGIWRTYSRHCSRSTFPQLPALDRFDGIFPLFRRYIAYAWYWKLPNTYLSPTCFYWSNGSDMQNYCAPLVKKTNSYRFFFSCKIIISAWGPIYFLLSIFMSRFTKTSGNPNRLTEQSLISNTHVPFPASVFSLVL